MRRNGNGGPLGQKVPTVRRSTIESLPFTEQSTIGPLYLVVILWTTQTVLVLSLLKRDNLSTLDSTSSPWLLELVVSTPRLNTHLNLADLY